MTDIFDSVSASTNIADLSTESAMQELLKAIEASMYYGYPKHEYGIRKTLNKLGVKSAYDGYCLFAFSSNLNSNTVALSGLCSTSSNTILLTPSADDK